MGFCREESRATNVMTAVFPQTVLWVDQREEEEEGNLSLGVVRKPHMEQHGHGAGILWSRVCY